MKAWREREGLTLDAAGAGVGTFRQTWFDWETERRIPNRVFMSRLYVFTRGAITADTMHFPRGYPDLDTPRLPLGDDPQAEAPLFDHADAAEPERQAA